MLKHPSFLAFRWVLGISFFALGCASEPTNQELCEASKTCEVASDGSLECVAQMKWENIDDDQNFHCVACDEGMEWATEDKADLECVPSCKYPEGFPTDALVLYDLAPPYSWEEAYLGDGSQGRFSFEEFYCDEDNDKIALIIVVSTGWCGSCPEYLAAFAEKAPILDAMGAQILYWIMETNDYTNHEVADNEFAYEYVDNYCGADGFSYRVGGTTTQLRYDNGQSIEDKPGSGYHKPDFVDYVPFGYVIKRDNMKVIDNSTTAYPQYQDFVDVMNRLIAGEFDDL